VTRVGLLATLVILVVVAACAVVTAAIIGRVFTASILAIVLGGWLLLEACRAGKTP
jgi:hypothetical protein